MKLKEGQKFRVVGFPQIPGLESGQEYRVAFISWVRGNPYYGLRRNRGRKTVAKHFTTLIDSWLDKGGLHCLVRT